jgi:hypothetical protein
MGIGTAGGEFRDEAEETEEYRVPHFEAQGSSIVPALKCGPPTGTRENPILAPLGSGVLQEWGRMLECTLEGTLEGQSARRGRHGAP